MTAECLDANAVQDFMAGALDTSARSAAIVHLDGCADCRDLLSLLARAATRDAAIDTLRDSDRRDAALLETAFSQPDALAETAAPGSATAPRRVSSPSQTGRVLGRYSLAERLGAGAMGVVYRADDRELKRSVALKLLHKPDPALTDRLVREARAMAKVNHPNVVAVYDVGVADGATYIAMELVSGGSLRSWVAADHTIKDVIEVYIAAGRGLAAAHAAGVVHRDFKPDNVLIGTDGRVRVTDFGLASAQHGIDLAVSLEQLELTQSGVVLGTPAYMAPEQFTGGNVDARTDQFNFCVALYEVLYGQRPFTGKTFEELGNAVCDGAVRPPPPRSRVGAALRAIVLRGLSTRPGDRYPTIDHLLDDLGRDRARPWRRAAIAAAAVGVALGIGLAADAVVRARTSTEISQSFTVTGRQTNRAIELLASRFGAAADQVYFLPIMRQVGANRDQADFGFPDQQAQDAENLERLHSELASADWTLPGKIAGVHYEPTIAIADYKGRLLYTSAQPAHWLVDLTPLPWVKAGLGGKKTSLVLVSARDPQLVATGIYGAHHTDGLAILFAGTLVLGGEAAGELIYIADAARLLDDIRLDTTLLSIIAPDGTAIGDVPRDLVAAARDVTAVTEIESGDVPYLVQAQPILDPDGALAGHLMMARTYEGVLSVFPGARTVFAIATLGALAAAIAMALRARRITNARR